jgi:hypothetical protein
MRALVFGLAIGVAPLASAQEPHECPVHAEHQSAVDQRHQAVTGVPSDATQHHFVVTKDGGVIRLDAKAGDRDARSRVRQHLQKIAQSFGAGDFAMPTSIHEQVPPGVAAMKERRASIQYRYDDTPNGGLVSITTRDPKALDAVHEFLRFQVLDHGTGDPTGQP